MIGIDIIPTQPPRGVSTIQGNFLSQAVQEDVKTFVREPDHGRLRYQPSLSSRTDGDHLTEDDLAMSSVSYLESERRNDVPQTVALGPNSQNKIPDVGEGDRAKGRTVDVVLSDMSEPWEQTEGFWKRSLSDPYYRMMNTSGINTRDHLGSMVSRRCLLY